MKLTETCNWKLIYILNAVTHKVKRGYISNSKIHGLLLTKLPNHINTRMCYFRLYFLYKVRKVQYISYFDLKFCYFFIIFRLNLFVFKNRQGKKIHIKSKNLWPDRGIKHVFWYQKLATLCIYSNFVCFLCKFHYINLTTRFDFFESPDSKTVILPLNLSVKMEI